MKYITILFVFLSSFIDGSLTRTFNDDIVEYNIFGDQKNASAVFSALRRLNDGGYLFSSEIQRDQPENQATKDPSSNDDQPDDEWHVNRKFLDQLFEGDIILNPKQAAMLLEENDLEKSSKNGTTSADLIKRTKRKIIREKSMIWPSNVIPYDFGRGLSSRSQTFIQAALNHWMSNTCLIFRRRNFGDYINFVSGAGCYSHVGRQGGRQTLSVGGGCEKLGVISHEIGHVLGFWHEQSRPDRDGFIQVNMRNVLASARANFYKLPPSFLNDYGVIYDMGSVMHYGPKAFTRNLAADTIETLDPNFMHTIGQRSHISFTDIKQINRLYCSTVCGNSIDCLHGGYPNPSNSGKSCNRCKCPEGLGGTRCDRVQSAPGNCQFELEAGFNWRVIQASGSDKACNWLITAPRGKHILFKMDELNMRCRFAACTDYVEVKYKDHLEQTGARFCCDLPPGRIVSSINKIVILYRTLTTAHHDAFFTARFRIVDPEPKAGVVQRIPLKKKFHNTIVLANPKTPVIKGWSEWSSWSPCDIPCGGCGKTVRRRYCYDKFCLGRKKQQQICGDRICVRLVHGHSPVAYCCDHFVKVGSRCVRRS